MGKFAGQLQSWYVLAMGDTRTISIPIERVLPAATEEAALVAELQAGSEEAYAYLLSVYRNPIYNMVYHIMGDKSGAGDVLQNTFIKIIRGIRQFHHGSSLKTWIYRIAVREALNYRRGWFRRLRHEVFSLDDDAHAHPTPVAGCAARMDSPYEMLEQQERREFVRRSVMTLAEPYRTAVVLREIENLSYEEIAQILSVAEGTVKSRIKRGRELLRRKLSGYNGFGNGCS